MTLSRVKFNFTFLRELFVYIFCHQFIDYHPWLFWSFHFLSTNYKGSRPGLMPVYNLNINPIRAVKIFQLYSLQDYKNCTHSQLTSVVYKYFLYYLEIKLTFLSFSSFCIFWILFPLMWSSSIYTHCIYLDVTKYSHSVYYVDYPQEIYYFI